MPFPLRLALPIVLSSAALTLPTPARATDGEAPATAASPPDAAPLPDAARPQRGWQLGGRLGYALPVGPLSSASTGSLSTRLSDLETASVPIAIEGGYRFSRASYLGGTIAWGAGIKPNSGGTCPKNDSCFRQDMQARLEGRLYLDPRARTGWWAAAGVGWEVATFSQSSGALSSTRTFSGPVLLDVELGVDARHDWPAIGPYLGVTFAEFLSQGLHPASADAGGTWIPSPGVHGWVTLGLRGVWGPY
jgi:hypothetical protein